MTCRFTSMLGGSTTTCHVGHLSNGHDGDGQIGFFSLLDRNFSDKITGVHFVTTSIPLLV